MNNMVDFLDFTMELLHFHFIFFIVEGMGSPLYYRYRYY